VSYIQELRKRIGTRPIIMVGASVIVRNEKGEFLLQKRADTLDWGLIGGAMEPGESLEETAARELMEEAGLKAERFRFLTLLSGKELYFRYPHGDEVYNVVAVYEALDVSGIPNIQDDEGLELKYFSLEDQDHYDRLNPISRVILRETGFLKH
jgi:8-oxo-dGTP pyrophosphatase MutT (NUDIX family)